MLALLGYNAPSDAKMYRPYIENTTSARWMTLGGVGLAGVGTPMALLAGLERGWVLTALLLPLILASGPAVWWLLYSFKRQAGILLGEDTLYLYQPVRYFNRTIPYHQIVACSVVNGTVAIIWLKERPTSIGDDPRPPKLVVLRSIELEHAEDCYAALQGYLTPHIGWQPKNAEKRIKRRAILRRLLFYAIFPVISAICVWISIRVVFSLLAL